MNKSISVRGRSLGQASVSMAVFLLLGLIAISGCSSKERVYEGIYEGMKMREQVVHPSNEPVLPKQPTYDEYQREREKILKESKEDNS